MRTLPVSQPARAVWIEIHVSGMFLMESESQPARAVWIEISFIWYALIAGGCHSLRGLCGLKLPHLENVQRFSVSQPARAVWIEIATILYKHILT